MCYAADEFFSLIEQALVEADLNVDHAQTPAGVARQIRDAIAHILAVYRDNASLARIFLREAIGLEPDLAPMPGKPSTTVWPCGGGLPGTGHQSGVAAVAQQPGGGLLHRGDD